MLLSCGSTRARDFSGFAELQFATTDAKTEDASGATQETETDTLTQRYGLTFRRDLYPRLNLILGATFERQDASLDPGGVDSERKLFLPYGRLTTRKGPFFALLGFDRSAERVGTEGFSSKRTRDTWRGVAGWSPEDLPKVRLDWIHASVYDPERVSLDSALDRANVNVDWSPDPRVTLSYRGLLEENQDRIEDAKTRTVSHNARIGASETWWGGRANWNASYAATLTDVTTDVGPTGEVAVPVAAFTGISSVDDTPQRDPLASNAALADRDRDASAGVDLAVPPPGGETRPRNFGLDFGGPTEVSRFLVWVDRLLTPEVSASFAWQVWTSEDNLDWTFRQTIPTAPFGPFENRFVIDFSSVRARYVKLVVSPLSAGVPGSSNFPNIFVTEVEALLRSPVGGRSSKFESDSHLLSTDLRLRLHEELPLFYEFSIFANRVSGRRATGTMTNALSIAHKFGPVLSGSARVGREDQRQSFGSTTAHTLGATLYATPLPRLNHSLSFGGRSESGDDARDEFSVALTSTASLYRGIDVSLFARRSGSRTDLDESVLTTEIGAGGTVTPHRTTTFSLFWQSGETDFRGAVAGLPSLTRRATETSVSWRPFPLLYLFAARRWEKPESGPENRLDSYSISWSPFPAGTVQIGTGYSETYRSVNDAVERVLTGSVRWLVTPRISLELAYQEFRVEERIVDASRESQTLLATARASF